MLDPLLREKEDVFSVVMIVTALVPSPALLLFVTRPDLFERLDTLQLLFLVSGVGMGFLTACSFAGLFIRDAKLDRANHIRARDGKPRVPREPMKEWVLLSMTAGFANIFLLLLSVWGYWHRIRLGASLVALASTILVASFIIHVLIEVWPINWTDPPRGQGPINPESLDSLRSKPDEDEK